MSNVALTMASDTYTLDGLALNDPGRGWMLRTGTGVRVFPGRVATGYEVAGTDGTRPSTGSRYQPGGISFSLVITGKTHAQAMQSLEVLYGVLGQRGKLLVFEHKYGDGTRRQALVEVLSSVTTEMALPGYFRLDVTCTVPSGVWRSPNTTDVDIPITTSSVTTTLTGLEGTGPIGDALLRFSGPFATATVSNPVSGDKLTVNTALAAGEHIIVYTAAWVARKVTTDTWSGGAYVSGFVESNRGAGPMLNISPDHLAGVFRNRLAVSGTNVTTAAKVTVRAKNSYL